MRISDWSSDVCSSDLAGAEDDGALLGDVVRHRGMAGARIAPALDGVAFQALRRLAGAQGGQRLRVAVGRFLLEPVGPRAAAVAAVEGLEVLRSEEDTSGPQALMRTSDAGDRLK